ncbi:PREDICTED: uncharacterized protein K02A2.6-like [Vollenhovia emeryi]|uniref:uncharacterized protein K02A2.6-like n=1 Tax=Vollenhovia emeryi TaxID=411798 RepID=UPI0005F4DDA6|nr:PREDICTED: uncharacterized protein K02A2.6-like [Vollenhovia emeryi]
MTDLSLDTAVQTAATIELSERGTKDLQGEVGVAQVQTTQKRGGSDGSGRAKAKSKKNVKSRVNNSSNITCYRCGKNHLASRCTLDRSVKCFSCGKTGHLRKVCRSDKQSSNGVDVLAVEHVQYRDKLLTSLIVNEKRVRFEIDSGAAVSSISQSLAKRLFPREKLHKTVLHLISYCKKPIDLLGYLVVRVRCRGKTRELNLYVTTGDREPLLGREWILQLKDHGDMHQLLGRLQSIHVIEDPSLQSFFREFPGITNPIISKISNIQARLTLKDNAKPVFVKARQIPFRLRALVEQELDRLESEGILEKVDSSEWATPIVPVLKKNGQVRLCGDFSVTINPRLLVDEHPLPTADELFASMAGGTIFSKIDLLQAYLQLEVRPEDQTFLTLSTHKGLYRATRLMYGVASAPAIWQRTIENILKDIPGVVVFLDDIRVAGTDRQDHLNKLRLVFGRLQKFNIRVNMEKSEFFMSQIQYCGYVIDKDGLHKSPEKMEAIHNMKRPTNVTEVRSFLGMINYYGRFISNLSSILHPLNKLLRKDTEFQWTSQCEKSFRDAKKAFISPKCLVHFDPRLPVTLATDASSYGVGAVLSHIYPDGSERAIQYASQTLSSTQRNYSQIDKEAYAIIYGVKKFHQYLQGSKFTLITDHRPLTQIFSPTKSLPIYTALRMQHYSLFLQGFNYDIKYRKSELHSNADCLSRLPIPRNADVQDPVDVFQLSTFDTLPITAREVATATATDKELSKLLQILKSGKNTEKEKTFYTVNLHEFTLQNNVIFRGHRVVIPRILQKKILQELHTGHFGVVRMKHLARGYIWWYQIDRDIENLVANCNDCNAFRNDPPKNNSHIWEPCAVAFERVHADFAGPFLGHYFFILVDAFSKWPEIHIVKDMMSRTTIDLCRQIFATHGLPKYFVSDNGRTFTSKEFRNFLQVNEITQKLTAPYHPATNGQAERYVQILKNSLKRMRCNSANVHNCLPRILLQYRTTPHATTGVGRRSCKRAITAASAQTTVLHTGLETRVVGVVLSFKPKLVRPVCRCYRSVQDSNLDCVRADIILQIYTCF